MVFHEVAIQPTAIQSIRDLQLVLSYVGFGKGRLIADFPDSGPNRERKEENWIWQVHQSVKKSQGHPATSVRELLIKERKKVLRTRRAYNHDRKWLDNARESHRQRPFGAIVTEQPSADLSECCLDDFSTDKCPECLREDQHVVPLPKTPEAFAEALMPMLSCAKELRFVDPYFMRVDSHGRLRASMRHGRVVKEITRRMNDNRRVPQLVEFHLASLDCSEPPDEQLALFVKEMGDFLPEGWKATAYLWGEVLGGRRFHARYVITDVGGAGSDYGFDQGNSPADLTDLYLLPDKVRTERSVDFSSAGAAFSLRADPREFRGTR